MSGADSNDWRRCGQADDRLFSSFSGPMSQLRSQTLTTFTLRAWSLPGKMKELCFEDLLIKVSGDASIVSDRRFETLAANAGQYVSTSYRDRLEGKPVHDEQGTYDTGHLLETDRTTPYRVVRVSASPLSAIVVRPAKTRPLRAEVSFATWRVRRSGIQSRTSSCRSPQPRSAEE
jgi:hypothetical protein